MKESHIVEFKESWRDEYLKWICGFANAEGGTLILGRNDKGKVVGVKDADRLLRDLPNKIRDVLGIMADVRLKESEGKELVEIRVDAYPSPVSFRGEYHYRSGSTKQELKGAALDRFLLRKYGRTWDSAPMPGVAPRDLSRPAIALFRKLARQSRRIEPGLLRESTPSLIEKLGLIEGNYLKRAALLLFHATPERFFPGAFVKIGYFRTESELLYHDEVNGDLFTQAQKAMDILLTKYLKAAISYRGIQRIESYPVPQDAIREALLNALIHRDYAIAAPIQIRVYDDKLSIWNPGELPETWTVRKLLSKHSSRPFNPLVANAFFRAGEIEAWGRGIQRIFDTCKEGGTPPPKIEYEPGDLWMEFAYSPEYLKIIPAGRVAPGAEPQLESRLKSRLESGVQSGAQSGVQSQMAASILHALAANPAGKAEIARMLGKSGRTRYLSDLMRRLLREGVVEYTIPDKPKSRLQKYRLTPKGRALLADAEGTAT